MTRARQWWTGLGVLAGVLLLAGITLVHLVPSDEELARRTAAELEAALGVKISVGAVHWHLLPTPAFVIEDAATVQAQPVVIKKLTVYPELAALWQRRIRLDRAELDGGVVPQLSLSGLGKRNNDAPKGGSPAGYVVAELPLKRFVFRQLTWISRRGIPVIYDGEIDFDSGWRPRTAELRRPEFQPATSLSLDRQGLQDRWTVRIKLGGGTANGEAQLQTSARGRLHLSGKLKPQQLEVSSALQAFNRRPVIAGKASGDTTFSADGLNGTELARSFKTQTSFVMGPARLLHFDLDKAIRTAGREHAGQTPLDSVSGKLETQNTADGMVTYFRGINAKSGSLSASGDARLFNRQIEAEFAVDLVKGVVGVPLKVSGPTSDVSVSVPGGAVAGAVVGTAVLPGLGTAIGARMGAALGKILGSGPDGKNSVTPARKVP